MARYKYTDNTQGLFMTVNLKEQLDPGTFEWTVDYLVDRLDMSLFDKKYNNDEKGACAYPPGLLLKIILFCYSRGHLSSRNIERVCKENVVAKALASGLEPDHSTIAAFISSNSEAVQAVFAQILLKCSELKLITGEMFAIDGCKLPSNASKEWSGKTGELQKKRDKLEKYMSRLLEQHKKLDSDKNAQRKQNRYKKTMGDGKERRERTIERIEKKFNKIDEYLCKAEPKKGVSGEEVKTNITDPQSAYMKSGEGYIQGYNGVTISDSANQIIICAKAIGSGPESGSFPEMLDKLEENMKTVTGKEDPLKKSLLSGDTGFFTEANLQEAAEREVDVLIPDPQFRQRDPYFVEKKNEKVKKANDRKFTHEDFEYDEGNDSFICPAGKCLEYKGVVELRNNSGHKYQARGGSCVNCPLKDRCITTKKKASKNPARTLYIAEQKYEENLSDKMRKKIDDPVYRELYSRRMQIIEPVFANIKYCKGMDRFMLRGEEKVDSQWQLYCIVHNIGKCIGPLEEKFKANRLRNRKIDKKYAA
jgi:transposase